jgi:hypothetical protein
MIQTIMLRGTLVFTAPFFMVFLVIAMFAFGIWTQTKMFYRLGNITGMALESYIKFFVEQWKELGVKNDNK